jgi:hypothetical protein
MKAKILNLLLTAVVIINVSLSTGGFAAVKDAKAQTKPPEEPKIIKNIVQQCDKETPTSDIVAKPEAYVNKEVCFQGVFSSFSALALDYPQAMRERKKYISLTHFRPSTNIPLGELKLAMPIEAAQKHEALPKMAEGDSVKIKGKVFNASLGEPWVDVVQIQVTKAPNSKSDGKSIFEEEFGD